MTNIPAVAQVPQSSLTEHSKEIDGITYYATAWPTMQALRMGVRLCQTFGQVGMGLLIEAFGVVRKDKDGKELPKTKPEGGALGAMLLDAASDQGSGVAVEEFIRECFQHVGAQPMKLGDVALPGKQSVHQHFEEHFRGRYAHLFEVFAWVCSVSFSRPGSASR